MSNQSNTVFLRLSQTMIGNTRKVNNSQVEVDADKTMIRRKSSRNLAHRAPDILEGGLKVSHTVSVKVEFRNQSALSSAVEALGGKVIGSGLHQLYGSSENGIGFTLPNWRYPLVVTDSGELKYDDFSNQWGRVADLDTLREEYALEAVRSECANLGWLCESSNTGGLIVYHPDGGTLSVTRGGSIDAAGFMGSGCAEASAKLEAALGRRTEQTLKPEYQLGQIEVGQGEE